MGAARTAAQLYVLLGLGVALLGALGGLVLSIATPPVYEAKARMMVSATGGPDGSAASYQQVTASQQVALSIVQFASSEVVAERVVRTLGLDEPAAVVAGGIEATLEPETVIIGIAARAGSPTQAREIANTTAFEFADFVTEIDSAPDPAAVRPRLTLAQAATTPLAPVAPLVSQNVALGGLAGLTLGFVMTNIRLRTDRRVRDGEVLRMIVGTELLGSVPARRRRTGSGARGMQESGDEDPIVREGYRGVRTTLRHTLRTASRRVAVVCGTGPDEGATAAALGIAEALAAADLRVLVVDADLRSSELTARLGADGRPGLVEAVAGTVELDDVVRAVPGQRFAVLPAGTTSQGPSELLGSAAAEALFGRLGEDYDYVVVDAPPVLACTDAAVVATWSDGVVLVVRHGEVRSDELEDAVACLRRVGARLLGPVLTCTPVSRITKRSVVGRPGVAPGQVCDTVAVAEQGGDVPDGHGTPAGPAVVSPSEPDTQPVVSTAGPTVEPPTVPAARNGVHLDAADELPTESPVASGDRSSS